MRSSTHAAYTLWAAAIHHSYTHVAHSSTSTSGFLSICRLPPPPPIMHQPQRALHAANRTLSPSHHDTPHSAAASSSSTRHAQRRRPVNSDSQSNSRYRSSKSRPRRPDPAAQSYQQQHSNAASLPSNSHPAHASSTPALYTGPPPCEPDDLTDIFGTRLAINWPVTQHTHAHTHTTHTNSHMHSILLIYPFTHTVHADDDPI